MIFPPGTHLSPPTPNHSRRSSMANSVTSQTTSTHPLLADLPRKPLTFPHSPFVSGPSTLVSRSGSPMAKSDPSTGVSLTAHYLPTKFSNPLLAPGAKRRKRRIIDPSMPKLGGGVEAFKSGEARIAGENDDSYLDLTVSGGFFHGRPRIQNRELRWNRFKWALCAANSLLTLYTLVGLIMCLLTWFDVWTNADVVRVGNRSELVISTLGACLGILTSLIGWAGLLLNNRAFLAMYTFLLWIVFIFLLIPGYLTYKRRAFNLEGKINAQWSRDLGASGRLRIQNKLGCCGYFSPFVEATVSQACYSRTVLPGCKGPYVKYQRRVLEIWYTTTFALVPLHISIIVAGLLCSNHVTYRFGKGMMPKAYRLSLNSMAVIMDNYANQLAEQYGTDRATDMMARSRSTIQEVDSMSAMPYAPALQPSSSNSRYNAIGSHAPETML